LNFGVQFHQSLNY